MNLNEIRIWECGVSLLCFPFEVQPEIQCILRGEGTSCSLVLGRAAQMKLQFRLSLNPIPFAIGHSINPVPFLEGFWLHDMPYMESCSITRKVGRISTDRRLSCGPLGPSTQQRSSALKTHAVCTPYPSGCLPALGTLTVSHQRVFWMSKALLHSAPAQQCRHSGTTRVNEICQDRCKDSTGNFSLTFHKIQS